jgi:hypothetical protein
MEMLHYLKIVGTFVAVALAIAAYLGAGWALTKHGLEKYKHSIFNWVSVPFVCFTPLTWGIYLMWIKFNTHAVKDTGLNSLICVGITVVSFLIVWLWETKKTSVKFGAVVTLYLATLSCILLPFCCMMCLGFIPFGGKRR